MPALAVATTMMASVTLGAQAGAAAEARPAAANVTITAALPNLTGLISAADNSGISRGYEGLGEHAPGGDR